MQKVGGTLCIVSVLRFLFENHSSISLFSKSPRRDFVCNFPFSMCADDLWAISKSLQFARGETFIARSTFHGPNTRSEVAIEPITGFAASLWGDGGKCKCFVGQ
jgi:hypothetical protein